jgi:hypothetical protein
MSLTTGTPVGNVVSQEEIYPDGAPNIYYQDYNADPLWNPDADGYYWGMSGTTAYPANELACVTEVSLQQGITANDVRCDTVGLKATVQRRDYIDFIFSTQNPFPLSSFANMMNVSPADVVTNFEKVGLGTIDNTQFWHVYAPKVYNDETGDYLVVDLHKCQFVNPGALQMRYGQPWLQQFTLRAYADTTKPAAQQFGTLIRFDPSVLG